MKVCFATILGRPNAGKSSLMNAILSYNVSIVTDTPQTTRDKITGIYTDDDSQIIFLDTPGIHKPLNKLGSHLNKNALETIKEVDVVLFLTPADEELGKGDLFILDYLKDVKNKIAVISKIDKIAKEPEKLTKKINDLDQFNFAKIVSTSINNDKSLGSLINLLKQFTYEDVLYYDPDYVTDVSMRFLAKEIVRESAINLLYQELPHSIAVEITEFIENDDEIEISGIIYVKRDSQKGMVIGKNAQMIKKIGQIARLKMQNQFGIRVHLNLNVKVAKKWVDDEEQIKKFGY
ncbi:GTPase Era [Mycoplasmopsis pullorum]|uniref:GTPase Era n=1 Tax=Mycoplasmopsis pullorum TaxID=48003 RepID=UPI00111A2F98|nr:GTPase Era [Mycoplasmopsis pullorum]TNK82590.1 GTPase Era [Mycoplasmopsis pullorum]TNK83489.1 GTPase Era [Mycoplasmopsis pullorum]TNK84714.1 GTPase Era [Mycoplasmopsis pullorum]TNK85745.1 GTPase Era [Mycoplasmopsis pullorum]TNK86286.1 GTPase Era [Mycoplasmopsis pullorum]